MRVVLRLLLTTATAAFLAGACFGQSAAPLLTPEQLVFHRSVISNVQISPDGKRIAMQVAEPPTGVTAPPAHLWEYQTSSQQLRQLTTAPKTQGVPRWSPDGSTLAYLSNSEGPAQIYLLPAAGEAVRLTDGKKVIGRYEWSPDGKKIAFIETDAPAAASKLAEVDPIVMTTRRIVPTKHHLWLIDIDSKEARQLSADQWDVADLAWFPDGARLALVGTDQPGSGKIKPRIYSVSIADGKLSELADPKIDLAELRVSPDGRQVSYVGERSHGSGLYDLYIQLVSGGPARNLTEATIDRHVRLYYWQPDGSILASAETGFGNSLYHIQKDGKCEKLPMDLSPVWFHCQSGLIAFISYSSTISLDELWLTDGKGQVEKATSFNSTLSQLPLIRPEFLHYKSFDGLEIEGELLKPRSFRPGARVPLIVLAHGGPVDRWAQDALMDPWGQLLAAHGYAVFYPNVRGSTGYSLKFSLMSRADLGGGDFKDLMAGVDYLIAQGIADPDRLGIGGWSYGGEMSARAITQTNRFKAAVVGAPVIDQLSEIGTEGDPSSDIDFFGPPYENQELLHRISPITYIKNVKTPTLILHGTEDVSNPIGQSKELFQALKFYGVECEFVIYPRERHTFREDKHNIDRLNRILRWYDTYLK